MFKKKPKSKEKIFREISCTFNKQKMEHTCDPENLVIFTTVQGDDFPIGIFLTVKEILIEFRCVLAFRVQENQLSSILPAINKINDQINTGAFVVNDEGWIMYRYVYLFGLNSPSLDFVMALLQTIITTVDDNDGPLKELLPISEDKYNPMFG